MSAEMQFLKKLQAKQSASASFTSKSQADIAEFRLRMDQLQEQMSGWLVDTGLYTEMLTVSVTDLLVEGGVFDISGIVLHYENRAVKFTPIFLYGQGVTGCVEVTLCAEGKATPLSRLFMRSGQAPDWSCRQNGGSRPESAFDEETFFEMIASLLS